MPLVATSSLGGAGRERDHDRASQDCLDTLWDVQSHNQLVSGEMGELRRTVQLQRAAVLSVRVGKELCLFWKP